jgi:hypothetical protein
LSAESHSTRLLLSFAQAVMREKLDVPIVVISVDNDSLHSLLCANVNRDGRDDATNTISDVRIGSMMSWHARQGSKPQQV